jgi:hypothetical protein
MRATVVLDTSAAAAKARWLACICRRILRNATANDCGSVMKTVDLLAGS